MSVTETPGVCAQHVIISHDCIKNHGVFGALDEAIKRISNEYLDLERVWRDNPDVKYHIVLTIERPKTIKAIGINPDSGLVVLNEDEQETKLYEDPDGPGRMNQHSR